MKLVPEKMLDALLRKQMQFDESRTCFRGDLETLREVGPPASVRR
jgi:hypothetical protein